MIVNIFLGFEALIFVSYGLYCLLVPEMLAEGAAISATAVTGTIELQSMYGGLQTAVGIMCLTAMFKPSVRQAALISLLFIFGGLAVVRVTLGLFHGDFSGYTVFAMVFESLTVAFLLWAIPREQKAAA